MATDNENRILNVPNLRFPEFSEEWKKTKIGDITSKVGSGVTPRGGSAVYKTAGHLFIRSQNVGNGCFLLDDVAYIDETTHKRQINTELKEGDVLLNITGASIGRSAVVDSSVAGGNVNQHVCIIRLQNNISPNFICNYLLSYGGQKQIDSFQAGGNREGLNFEQIRSIKFSIPSFEEQCKISTLLSLLDRRIATQNKIIEQLESLIKGLCQKLTQQDNPNTTLNECLKCYSSTLQESSVLEVGDFPVYGATGVCGYTDVPEVDGDSILIIKDGASVGVTYYASGKYSAIGTLNRLATKDGYSLRYLYYCLKVFNFAPYRTGLAIPHIYFRDYGKAQIWCPPIEEQNRIANALEKVEQKIATEKSLLEQLYSQKRFLLQAMFI